MDQKIKTAADKVPLNLLPLGALKGAARVFGYGARKYAAGNFLTATDDDIGNRYAGGALRHLAAAQRPDGLYDVASLAALDDESGLPELDHMICGLIMLRAQLVKRGALAEDPGVGKDPATAAPPRALSNLIPNCACGGAPAVSDDGWIRCVKCGFRIGAPRQESRAL